MTWSTFVRSTPPGNNQIKCGQRLKTGEGVLGKTKKTLSAKAKKNREQRQTIKRVSRRIN